MRRGVVAWLGGERGQTAAEYSLSLTAATSHIACCTPAITSRSIPEIATAAITMPTTNNIPMYPESSKRTKRAKEETPVQRGGGLRKRWKDPKGKIYELDRQEDTVEVYTKRGKHLGEFDHRTGKQLKPAKRGRRAEP